MLTDSDGAGFVIRNYLKGALPQGRIKQAYVPDVAGKSGAKSMAPRRASSVSRGCVRGLSWTHCAAPAQHLKGKDERAPAERTITKADFFEWGLSGRPDSTVRPCCPVLKALDLPQHMTANALLEFINAVGTRQQLCEILQSFSSGD